MAQSSEQEPLLPDEGGLNPEQLNAAEPDGGATPAAHTQLPTDIPDVEPVAPSPAWEILRSFVRKAPTNGARVSESLDYEPIQNELQISRVRAARAKRYVYGYSGLTLAKTIVVLLTGLITGLLALVMTRSSSMIMEWRNDKIQHYMDSSTGAHSAFAFYLLFSVSVTCFGGSLVSFLAPASAGAGVTLVIAYLNGNHIPNLLRFRTLIVKLIGTICAIVAGMAVGPEGPMVHIGAAVASNIAYFNCAVFNKISCLFPCLACRTEDEEDTNNASVEDGPAKRPPCAVWEDLHEDSEHREFISAGAAAGLSAAFGAPIGGVLFSMEEACSFWSKKVAWRCFSAAIMSAIAIAQFTPQGDNGLIVFSNIKTLSNKEWLWQLPLMVAVASLGGVLGGVFNHMRRALWPVRASRSRKFLRVGELMLVTAICVTLAVLLSYAYGDCSRVPPNWPEDFKGIQFNCAPGEHNDLATLFLSVPDEILKRLFSIGRDKVTDHREACGFCSQTLLIYSVAYIVMMALGAGTCIPAGLFMPAIMLGACMGLACGLYFDSVLGDAWHIQPGLYALICSTATLAGVFRSAISLVVIVVEGTRGIDFLFGVIIAVVTANWVSSFIHHDGVYESELERDGNIFFLSHDPPQKLQSLTAEQIMVRSPVCFSPIVPVRDVLSVLTKCTHNGFPVINQESAPGEGIGQLEGLILRSQLLVLMRQRAFCDAQARPVHRHLTQNARQRLEREMRLFYRHSYTHHRYMATLDPGVYSLQTDLQRETAAGGGAPLLQGTRGTNSDSRGSRDSRESWASARNTNGGGSRGARDSWGGLAGGQLKSEALQLGAENDTGLIEDSTAVVNNLNDDEVSALQHAITAVGHASRLCIDLRPYMNTAPLTVHKEMSAARCHRTFVTLGMRHLCVTNHQNRVVGIITRKDLNAAAGHGHAPPAPVTDALGLSRTHSIQAGSSSSLRSVASRPLSGLFSLLTRRSSSRMMGSSRDSTGSAGTGAGSGAGRESSVSVSAHRLGMLPVLEAHDDVDECDEDDDEAGRAHAIIAASSPVAGDSPDWPAEIEPREDGLLGTGMLQSPFSAAAAAELVTEALTQPPGGPHADDAPPGSS